MADPGEGPGGPTTPLLLDQTEARRAEKKILETGPPLSQDLDDPPPPLPPPYLKVCIRHCFLCIHQAPVVQTLDTAIHRINHYPAEKYRGNQLSYPLDSYLCTG